jgi:FtsZ-interacting cell division protein YlmF
MFVTAWGPTLVMVFAVLLAGILWLGYAARARTVRSRNPFNSEKGSVSLSAALREAESINAYSPALSADLSVHLAPIARIAPLKYEDAVDQIPLYFAQGHVVSVDLNGMSASQAARLVDFCSGYLIGASGWLFRAAEKVIVLTPTTRKVDDAT